VKLIQGVFFNPNVPNYMNYGSIGMVIGHEITHGFDDRGKQKNGNGNYNNKKLRSFILILLIKQNINSIFLSSIALNM